MNKEQYEAFIKQINDLIQEKKFSDARIMVNNARARGTIVDHTQQYLLSGIEIMERGRLAAFTRY